MAIDTIEKRSSIALLNYPTGSVTQEDRQTIAWIYVGVLAGSGIITVPTILVVAELRDLDQETIIHMLNVEAELRDFDQAALAQNLAVAAELRDLDQMTIIDLIMVTAELRDLDKDAE